jgi:autotransporter-associated beta strand protein
MKLKSTLRSFLALAGSSLLAISYTHAANIWDGGGGNGNWNTATNWDNDFVPAVTGQTLTFTGDLQTNTTNDAGITSVNGILFTNDGSPGKTMPFTLGGSSLTLNGNITTTANTTGSTITDVISLELILNGNRSVTTNQLSGTVQHNVEISGVISQSGTRSLIKSGGGTLTLSGNAHNTFTGAMFVNRDGKLLLAKTGSAQAIAAPLSFGETGNVSVATVQYTGDSSDMIGNVTVTARGPGILDFNGKTDTIGNFVVNSIDLRMVNNTPIINTAGGGNLTIGSLTIGTRASTVINPGTGTLTLGGDVAFNPTANGQAQISSGVGGSLALGAATRTFNVGAGTGHDLLIDAVISGSGVGLTKAGAGRLILGGSNTYNGLTTVSAGRLTATHGSALNGGGGLTINADQSFVYEPTVAGPLTLGAGVLTLGNGTTTSIGTALAGTASQSAITSSSAASLAGTGVVNIYGITGVAPAVGTNSLITATGGLDGGTYTLGTVYNNTNFTVSNFDRSTGTAISVDVASATALSGNVNWKGGLAGNTGVWAASNGSTLSNWQVTDTVDQPLAPGATADLVFSTATTPGTMVGMSLGANMTVRSVTVNDTSTAFGLLGDGRALTITPASPTTGLTIATGVQASTIAANVVLGADQTWTNHSANTLTVTGVISGSGNLTKAGTGRINLSGENTFDGDITLSAGTLGISFPTANRNDFTIPASATVTLDASIDQRFDNNSSYALAEKGGIAINDGANLTLLMTTKGNGGEYKASGALTGSGTLNIEGSARFDNSSNTFTGPINLNSGTVASRIIISSLADATSLGSGDITLTTPGIGDGRTFRVDNGATGNFTFTNRRFVLAGGAQGAGKTSIVYGTNSTLTIASNIINTSTAVRLLTLSGGVGPGSGTISGTISDSTNDGEALTVKHEGTGTWNLTNSLNSYTGGTQVGNGSNDGAVLGFASGALGTTGNILAYRSTLRWLAGNTQDISARLLMFNDARTTTLDTNGNDVIFANAIGRSSDVVSTSLGNFAKAGLGTLTLQGTNTYTGTTRVTAGTLIVDGSISNSSQTDVFSGTLGGIGTVGPLTIGNSSGSADAILAPGNGIGSIATGNLAFNSDGSYAVELNGTLETTDVTNVTGTVTINAATTLTVNVTGTLSAGQEYVIVSNDAADAVTGTFAGLAEDAVVGTYGGIDLRISYIGGDGNDIVLYTPAASGTAFDTWKVLGTLGPVTFDGDTNGDGVKDGLAFLLGAANPDDDAIGRLPTVTESGGDLILTFNCLTVAARGTATLKVAHSSDLGDLDPWTSTVDVVPDADDAVPDNDVTFVVGAGPAGPPALNSVTATIDAAAAADGKLFGRLVAEQP